VSMDRFGRSRRPPHPATVVPPGPSSHPAKAVQQKPAPPGIGAARPPHPAAVLQRATVQGPEGTFERRKRKAEPPDVALPELGELLGKALADGRNDTLDIREKLAWNLGVGKGGLLVQTKLAPGAARLPVVAQRAQAVAVAAVGLRVGNQVTQTHRNGGFNWGIVWELTGGGAATANGYIVQEVTFVDEIALCATGLVVSTERVHYFEAWKVTNGAIEADGLDVWHFSPTCDGVTRSARVVGKAKFMAGAVCGAWGRGVAPFALNLRSSFVAPAHWDASNALVRSVGIESAACRGDRFYELYVNGGAGVNWRTYESDDGFAAPELRLLPGPAVRRAAAKAILEIVADYLRHGGPVNALIRRALQLAFAEINFGETVQAVLDLADQAPGLLLGLAENL